MLQGQVRHTTPGGEEAEELRTQDTKVCALAAPYFVSPVVHVVDGVAVVVLDVPAEGGEQHTDVKPGHSDTRNA